VVGDVCVVFREKNSDFFRPMVTDEMLGGWFPAKVTKVEVDHMLTNEYRKFCQRSRKKKGAAESGLSGPPPEPQTYYKVTVASDFFSGTKNYSFPCESQSILLADFSTEDVSAEDADGGYSHQSYTIRGDTENVIFQASPDKLAVGDLVFARYQAGERWYRGRVASVYRQAPPQPDGPPLTTGAAPGEAIGDDDVGEGRVASVPSSLRHIPPPPVDAGTDLCCVAYDGDQHGLAAYETDVPYRECIDGRPIVYLAHRGRHDLRWLKLELERIRDSGEKMYTLDPSGQILEPNTRDVRSGAVITVVLQRRPWSSPSPEVGAGATVGPNNAEDEEEMVFQHYRYEDVVSAVFEAAFARDKGKISVLEWPENPNIQKNRPAAQGGGKRKNHKRAGR
jgi:hypothetical protein